MKQPPHRSVQFTVRGVPPRVEQSLRRRARSEGKSLNTVLVEALAQASRSETDTERFDDLDHLAGHWRDDPEFDAVLQAQDQVDESLWK